MTDSVVGLVIESGSIRAVEIKRWRSKRPSILRSGEVDLPNTAFIGGAISDSDQVSLAMASLWRQAGFSTKRLVIAVDGRQAIVRRTVLPEANPDRLRRSAGFDIEELLSYPVEEAIFDVAEIDSIRKGDAPWVSALVVAIHHSTRTNLMGAAYAAGLEPIGVQLVSEAVVRAVAEKDGVSEDRITAIVNVGESESDVVIRDRKGTLFSRALSAGVGDSALNIADELESQLEGLAGYRSPSVELDDSERRASAAQAGVSTVVEGVRRTLSYYQSEMDHRALGRLVLVGSRSEVAGLQSSMAQTLEVPVEVGQPQFGWRDSLGNWSRFATAVGVVLAEAGRTYDFRSFSLVPHEEQQLILDRRRRLIGVAAATVTAVVLLSATLAKRGEVEARNLDAIAAAEFEEQVRLQVSDYEEAVVQQQNLARMTAEANQILSQDIGFSIVLQELAVVMPEDSQLVSIQMRRATLDEQVMGYVAPQPAGIISLSGLAPNLAGVADFVEGAAQNQFLDGIWLRQSSEGEPGVATGTGVLFSVDGVISDGARPQSELLDEWPMP